MTQLLIGVPLIAVGAWLIAAWWRAQLTQRDGITLSPADLLELIGAIDELEQWRMDGLWPQLVEIRERLKLALGGDRDA